MVNPWQLVFDPEWLIGLLIVAADYVVVVRAYERRGRPVSWRRRLAFTGGLAITALALFSPIEHLALHSMLSFHLLQNVMLGDWAPPLFLLGLSAAMTQGLARQRWVAVLANPPFALGLWLVTWYVTHIPAVYDYALRNQGLLGVEHLAFLISGLAFWWPEIVPGYLTPIGKISYLALAFLAISPLDLFVYLANHPLYSFYVHTPKLGGISALADQQIAGVAMAIESNLVLLTVIAFALMRLLAEEPAADRPAA
ncbi:MAG TPA: cytochrome c oxidase assembly protein [Gaiellales bacterium]